MALDLPLFDGPYETQIHIDEVNVSSTVRELKLCASKIIIATQNNRLAYYRTDGSLVYHHQSVHQPWR